MHSAIYYLKKMYKRYRYKKYFFYPSKKKMGFDAVFVVGANKTGTTSMHHYLKKIGLRHLSINEDVKKHYFNKNFKYLDRLTKKFHSFDDLPWNKLDLIERYMARKEYDYRFILTVRDPDLWFDSCVRFSMVRNREIPEYSQKEKIIQLRLNRHNDKVIQLSEKFDRKLLIVDVTKDKNANQKISEFLDIKSVLQFPHANRTT